MTLRIVILPLFCAIGALAAPVQYNLDQINNALGTGLAIANALPRTYAHELRRAASEDPSGGFVFGYNYIGGIFTPNDIVLEVQRSETLDFSSHLSATPSVVAIYLAFANEKTTWDGNQWVGAEGQWTLKAWPYGDDEPFGGPGVTSFFCGTNAAGVCSLVSMTDDQGRITLSVSASTQMHFVVSAYLETALSPLSFTPFIPGAPSPWWVIDIPRFFDGTGAVNASGTPTDGHTKPALDPAWSWPASPALGDYTFADSLGNPAWFDGTGWINAAGAPVDGHTKPAPDGGYLRPASPAEGDMDLDQSLWIPIWWVDGAWINATGAPN